MMKKYYFINKFDTNNIDKQDKQTIIIYRKYDFKKINEDIIIKIHKYCKKKSIKFYLSNNIKLALKLNLDGVYIPAFNNCFKHLSYAYKKNFKVIGSAHNLKEIRIKEKQKVEKIVLSSVFKKNKNFLGIYRFKMLKNLSNKNFIALGGVSKTNTKILKTHQIKEFAGISFFG